MENRRSMFSVAVSRLSGILAIDVGGVPRVLLNDHGPALVVMAQCVSSGGVFKKVQRHHRFNR
jgi:hypothetical protein